MNERDSHQSTMPQANNSDSFADAFAAVVIILIAVATAVFWVSQQ